MICLSSLSSLKPYRQPVGRLTGTAFKSFHTDTQRGNSPPARCSAELCSVSDRITSALCSGPSEEGTTNLFEELLTRLYRPLPVKWPWDSGVVEW